MSSSSGFGSGTSFGSTPLGTSPFYDVSGMIDGILRVTGHGTNPAGETVKRQALVTILNNKYQEICAARNWRWLRATYDFPFLAPYSDGGMVYVANGSYKVYGVGTLFSAAMKPKDMIWFAGDETTYRIASIESSQELTLESPYAGDTILLSSPVTFTSARSQYKLPKETGDILIVTLDGIGDKKLVPVGPDELQSIQARQGGKTGIPRCYSLVRRETDDDAQYMEVWPAPDRDYNVHIAYNVRILYLEDKKTCFPIIPDRYRAVLYYAALSEFYYTVLRDPLNADRAYRDYQNFYTKIANDKQSIDDSAQIIPARNYVRRACAAIVRGFRDLETFRRDEY
jgi:hypothetical protein